MGTLHGARHGGAAMKTYTEEGLVRTTLCYVERDGCWLMLHRVKKKQDLNQGKWIGIGGHVEPGETPEECVRREAREETGLVLTHLQYRGVIDFLNDCCESEVMYLYTADGAGPGSDEAFPVGGRPDFSSLSDAGTAFFPSPSPLSWGQPQEGGGDLIGERIARGPGDRCPGRLTQAETESVIIYEVLRARPGGRIPLEGDTACPPL